MPKKIILFIVALLIVGSFALIDSYLATATQQTATTTTQSSGISAAEVATHDSVASCWAIVAGSVYDLTTWIRKHPGGPEAIVSLCGTDGTAAFTAQHGSNATAQAALATFFIGNLTK